MLNYKLAPEAEADLERIFDFGIDTFGLQQAIKYIGKLKGRFDEIANNPLVFPEVGHIRKGYRRSVCGVHSIYYRINPDVIEIMRLLHKEGIEQQLGS